MANEITRYDVNDQARVLMDIIDMRSHEIEADHMLARLFVNGRERGWTLAPGTEREISFAECRGMDSIILYPFRWNDGDPTVNYKARSIILQPRDFETAATFVIYYLNTGDLDGLPMLLQPGGSFRRGSIVIEGNPAADADAV